MSTRPHPLRAALATALTAAVLAGCGVRLESPPPDVPVADSAEEARQGAALSAHELGAMVEAAQATTTDAELAAALAAVGTATAEHHAALGGVWEPWPGAGPGATAHPGPDPTATSPSVEAVPDDVLAALVTAATMAHDDAIAHPGELGQLLGSIAVSRTYLAADLAAALGTEATTLPAAPLPVPGPGGIDPATSRAVDAGRYALVVVAARSAGEERAAAVERADHLAAVAGAVAPEEDDRDVAYDVTAATADDGGPGLAAAAELDVVRAYVTLLASATDGRADVLAAAVDAAGEARSWGTTLPALPGLS